MRYKKCSKFRVYPHLLRRWTWASPQLRNRVLMGSMHTGLEDGRDLSRWPRTSASAPRAAWA
jgi:hypothetical protein